MSFLRSGVALPLVGGLAGFLYFAYGRDYPFRLALVMGAAMMMLGWVAARTWKGLRGDRRH